MAEPSTTQEKAGSVEPCRVDRRVPVILLGATGLYALDFLYGAIVHDDADIWQLSKAVAMLMGAVLGRAAGNREPSGMGDTFGSALGRTILVAVLCVVPATLLSQVLSPLYEAGDGTRFQHLYLSMVMLGMAWVFRPRHFLPARDALRFAAIVLASGFALMFGFRGLLVLLIGFEFALIVRWIMRPTNP